jgi:hypothetical protein
MSSVFWQDADVDFAEPRPDAWKIAADLAEIAEGVVGESWKRAKPVFDVTTASGVSFEGPDVESIRALAKAHGAPLRLLSMQSNIVYPGTHASLSTWVMLHFSGDRAASVSFTWAGPQRADIESTHYAFKEVMSAMQRRARWRGARVSVKDLRITTRGSAPSTEAAPLVRARGARSQIRRWFVRNRDNLIISLGGGVLVTATWAVLQAVGVIPTLN